MTFKHLDDQLDVVMGEPYALHEKERSMYCFTSVTKVGMPMLVYPLYLDVTIKTEEYPYSLRFPLLGCETLPSVEGLVGARSEVIEFQHRDKTLPDVPLLTVKINWTATSSGTVGAVVTLFGEDKGWVVNDLAFGTAPAPAWRRLETPTEPQVIS